jgi:cytochrome c oxidase subunit II
MARTSSALVLAALAGCEGPQSALDPKGPHAVRIYELGNIMFAGGAVIFFVVVALVLIAVALPRQEGDTRKRLRWVLVGVICTIAILIALLAYNAATAQALSSEARDPVEVRIVARQWWWDITYIGEPPSESARTANELRIPVGKPVRIELESLDVIHSFWVPSLHGKRDAIPGRTNHIWIQADVPGTYRGQCAEFCGLQHANMAFLVVAMPPAQFEAWLAHQRRPAAPPRDEAARRGQHVFMRACAKCHAVRGTDALPTAGPKTAGPDLTHLASRLSLAAETIPNNRGYLGGWILDPQHFKPGALMPPVAMDSDSFHALLAYQETLR